MSDHQEFKIGKINPLMLLLGLVLVMVLLFYVAKKILGLLAWAAPFILIAALIINYRVVWGYAKWLVATVKRNPVFGIVAILFTIIGFPLVSIFLLLRALSSKGIGSGKSFTKYEEVEDDFLDISEIKEYEKKVQDGFDDLSS